jgi:hypothetical protein
LLPAGERSFDGSTIGGLSQSPALCGIRRRRRRDGEESLHRRTLFTINDIASARQNLLSLQSTDFIDNPAATIDPGSLKTIWRHVRRTFARTMFRKRREPPRELRAA